MQKYFFLRLHWLFGTTVYNISNLLRSGGIYQCYGSAGNAEKSEDTRNFLVCSWMCDTITNIPLECCKCISGILYAKSCGYNSDGEVVKKYIIRLDLVSRFNMIIAIPYAAAFITLGTTNPGSVVFYARIIQFRQCCLRLVGFRSCFSACL